VKRWCEYTWATQKSFDEAAILETLPKKIRTDVTLDVHYKTLKGVKLFRGCDPGLLKELVIKLKPIIFLSGNSKRLFFCQIYQFMHIFIGDYICKKGDIGKEMFIITVGQVQVVGGENDSIVFVTLGEGVCFGEIALLGSSEGTSRRTANVRALGFTTLYVLFKEDLSEALQDVRRDDISPLCIQIPESHKCLFT
jgi:cyclic nucleotide gated channel beta 1